MTRQITTIKHGLIAKTLHWSFIVLFLFGLTKQLDGLEQLQDFALLRFEMIFAALFLVVLVGRYIYMQAVQPTAMPQTAPGYMRIAARVGHLCLYLSLGGIAVSGLAIGSLYWLGFTKGMFINLAVVLHEFAVIASYAMIALHIAAAVFHRLKEDGVWSAMVPVWTEKPD